MSDSPDFTCSSRNRLPVAIEFAGNDPSTGKLRTMVIRRADQKTGSVNSACEAADKKLHGARLISIGKLP